MKVTKWVSFETEVDVDVDVEEFIASLSSNAETLDLLLNGLSRFHKLLKHIPAAVIKEMNDKQKEITLNFLSEQARRFQKEDEECHYSRATYEAVRSDWAKACKEREELRNKAVKFEDENEALNLSVGILNKRLMTAMELLRRWKEDSPADFNLPSPIVSAMKKLWLETDEFLKGEPK